MLIVSVDNCSCVMCDQVVADCDPKRAEIYDKMDQVLLRSTSDGLKDLKVPKIYVNYAMS